MRRLGLCGPLSVLLATAALVLAAPAAAPALVSTCAPTFNGPGTVAPGTVVAPYLRVVTSSNAIGTCDSTIAPTTQTPDGALWGVDMGGAKNGLWRSTDGLQTWQLVWQPTQWTTIEHVLPLASGAMLAVVVDSAGIRHIVRAPDQTGTSFSSTTSLDFPAGARIHSAQSWVETGGAIYVAEYGDPTPPVVLWKSTDDGRTFSVVYSRTDIRHYHAVQADPNRAGRIWLTTGDAASQSRIGYSDDGGTTFTWITAGTYPRSRALTLMFTPEAVYWGSDSPDVPATLSRWDRTTGAVTTVLSNLNGPFYNSFEWNGVHLQFTTVERAVADGYIGDDFIHVLTSSGGSGWRLTRTPYVRTTGATDQIAGIWHFTQPDAQGRFWAAFFNMNGSQFQTENVLFQIDPNATYSGASAAFAANPGSGTSASFDGSGSTSPAGGLAWSWQFGDGTTGTGATVSHTYGSAGTYVVRLQVKDAVGDASETTRTVTVGSTTQPPPPSATTGAATAVSTSGATLNGSVNANGTSTSVVFQYGTTSAYGSQTPAQDAGAGTTAVAVQAILTGLSPGTTYHFRIVATSARGTTNGADATFTTAVVVQPPTATTQAPTHFPGGKAQFAGIVNPGGGATTYFFRYGTTTAYGSQTQTATLTAGTADVNVSANSAKLVSGTVYHVQLVATNAAGTAYGADVAFTAR